jgi:uncharacterized membrane protein (UPF0136 family)
MGQRPKLTADAVNVTTGRPDGFALEYLGDLYYIRAFDVAITSTLTSEVHKYMIAWLVLIYGILMAAGGVMGYVRKDSMASLIAGGISGIALLGAAVAMMKGAYSAGWWISLVVALLLLIRFGIAALKGGFKMMPGGFVIILSIIVIAALLANREQ